MFVARRTTDISSRERDGLPQRRQKYVNATYKAMLDGADRTLFAPPAARDALHSPPAGLRLPPRRHALQIDKGVNRHSLTYVIDKYYADARLAVRLAWIPIYSWYVCAPVHLVAPLSLRVQAPARSELHAQQGD